MSWKVPLYKIYWDEDDVKSVTEVIKQGMFWATGPNVEKFERIAAGYIGVEHAVAFNSGTSALHALLLACDVGKDDEVIVPSFSFIATANSALFVGARPVFADIEKETYGLDPEDVKERISQQTKVIMPIHYGGLPCRIRELREIADDHNLLLIEDAAESMGASIHEKKAGSFGHAAMLSFCGNKVITTGEGGIILTDSRQVCEKLKLIRSHGRLETENYFASSKPMEYVTLGFNWRLSNIIAALGISQMRKLSKVIEMRRKNARYLTEQISKMQDIDPPTAPAGYFGIYQMYTIYVKGGKERRDILQQHLADSGIGTKVYFRPVHLTHFYRKEFGYRGGELPETEELSDHVLSLPMYPTLAREEMDYVLDTIKEIMRTF